jgi:hypothetical protein
MSKPIPDKAEVALEYPDKLYIGTFERSSRFDAHLDETGISLSLQRTGEVELRKSIRMHFHYALFAEILQDLARTVSKMPPADTEHRNVLREGAKALYRALGSSPGDDRSEKRGAPMGATDPSQMTPEEEVLLLHVME